MLLKLIYGFIYYSKCALNIIASYILAKGIFSSRSPELKSKKNKLIINVLVPSDSCDMNVFGAVLFIRLCFLFH